MADAPVVTPPPPVGAAARDDVADVCLVVEGSYPFVANSTAAWLHRLIGGLPELSVALSEQMIETIRTGAQTKLEALATDRGALAKFGKIIVATGDARDSILEAVRLTDADLIVMGTHGRRGVSRLVLGSVAEDVVRRAPCPVLTVRMEKPS